MILTGRVAGANSHSISLHLEASVGESGLCYPYGEIYTGGFIPGSEIPPRTQMNCEVEQRFEPYEAGHWNDPPWNTEWDEGHPDRFVFSGWLLVNGNLTRTFYAINGTSCDVSIEMRGGDQLEGIDTLCESYPYMYTSRVKCNLGPSEFFINYTYADYVVYVDGHLITGGQISGDSYKGFAAAFGVSGACTGSFDFITLTSSSININGTYSYSKNAYTLVDDPPVHGADYWSFLEGSGHTIRCWTEGGCAEHATLPGFGMRVDQAACSVTYNLEIPEAPEGVVPKWTAIGVTDPMDSEDVIEGYSATRDYEGLWEFGFIEGAANIWYNLYNDITMTPENSSYYFSPSGWAFNDTPPATVGNMYLKNPEDFNDVYTWVQAVDQPRPREDHPEDWVKLQNTRIMFTPEGIPTNQNITITANQSVLIDNPNSETMEQDDDWTGYNCTVTASEGGGCVVSEILEGAYITKSNFAHVPYGDEGDVPASMREAHWPSARFVKIGDGHTNHKELILTVSGSLGTKDFKHYKLKAEEDPAENIYGFDICFPTGLVVGDTSIVDDYYRTHMADMRELYAIPPSETPTEMYRTENGWEGSASYMPWDWGISLFNEIKISGFKVEEDLEYEINGLYTHVENIQALCYDEWIKTWTTQEWGKKPKDPEDEDDDVPFYANRRMVILVDGKPCDVLVNNLWISFPKTEYGYVVEFWSFFTIDGVENAARFPRDDCNSITVTCPSNYDTPDANDNYPIGKLFAGNYALIGWLKSGRWNDNDNSVTIPITPRFDIMDLDWRWNNGHTVCNGSIDMGSVAHGLTPTINHSAKKNIKVHVTDTSPFADFDYHSGASLSSFYTGVDKFGNVATLSLNNKSREIGNPGGEFGLPDGYIYNFSVVLPASLGMSIDAEPAGRHYLVYVDSLTSKIALKKSDDYGVTWGDSVDVAQDAITPTITASWQNYQNLVCAYDGSSTIYKRVSADEGTTWGDEVELWTGTRPFLYRDPVTDMKLLFWYDDGKIKLRRSADNCETWLNDAEEPTPDDPLVCVLDAADESFIVTNDGSAESKVMLIYRNSIDEMSVRFSTANGLPPYNA